MSAVERPAARERRFELPGLDLAALEWGALGGMPALMLHGWLDNAGTFDLLAPLLPGRSLIALDLAGHGMSDYRSADSGYSLWQDAGDVLEVADRLEWPRFNLIGHSRGAAIATLFAAAFPERIDKLVLLEGGIPFVGQAEDAPGNLAKALVEQRELLGKSGRVFTSRDVAIDERVAGFSKVSRAAALVLARRSLESVTGGFRWRADQRLKAASPVMLGTDDVRAFVKGVRAPVLMVLADGSPFGAFPLYRQLIPEFADLTLVRLPGGHHFHLEGAEHEIAEHVQLFLKD